MNKFKIDFRMLALSRKKMNKKKFMRWMVMVMILKMISSKLHLV